MSMFAFSVAAACANKAIVDRPPHFPDPNADPIAILEQALRDKDDIIADQYHEMTAWREQLEAALAQINSMEAANVHP